MKNDKEIEAKRGSLLIRWAVYRGVHQGHIEGSLAIP